MNDMILILDGSPEYGLELARRLRAEQIHACVAPMTGAADRICALAPQGVILCGEGCDESLGETVAALDIPVLAIGQAAYALLRALGGVNTDIAIANKKAQVVLEKSELFTGAADGERFFREAQTLMLPADVRQTAAAGGCTVAFEDSQKKKYGVQFEPERNDPQGSAILMNFALDICQCTRTWTLEAALSQAEEAIGRAAAQGGHAICAVSGGVDSALCALLAHRAFGERMTAVFVDTGLMREGETDAVQATLEALDIPVQHVDLSGEILQGLRHKYAMEEKRTVVVERLYAEMLTFATISGLA